jgi:hypothetical protein
MRHRFVLFVTLASGAAGCGGSTRMVDDVGVDAALAIDAAVIDAAAIDAAVADTGHDASPAIDASSNDAAVTPDTSAHDVGLDAPSAADAGGCPPCGTG